NLHRSADTFPYRIVQVPARTRIHRGDKHELRRILHTHSSAADRDESVFYRLAQDLEDLAFELGQLVQKQDAVVRQRDLARHRVGPSPTEPDIGNRVMRRPERPGCYQTGFRPKLTPYRADLRRLKGFLHAERREDRRNSPGEHRSPRSRWTDRQHVVPARGGPLQRSFYVLLPPYFGKIDRILLAFFKQLDDVATIYGGAVAVAAQHVVGIENVADRIDRNALHHGRLCRICRRDQHRLL